MACARNVGGSEMRQVFEYIFINRRGGVERARDKSRKDRKIQMLDLIPKPIIFLI